MHDTHDSKHYGLLSIEDDVAYWLDERSGFYGSQKISFCPYCGEDLRKKLVMRCYHGMPKNCCDVCDQYDNHGDRIN